MYMIFDLQERRQDSTPAQTKIEYLKQVWCRLSTFSFRGFFAGVYVTEHCLFVSYSFVHELSTIVDNILHVTKIKFVVASFLK